VPELVVTLAALRLGAINLAIGNIFGSNMFNMLVLAIDDLFYAPGTLLAAVSPTHLVSSITAMTMTGIVVVALYLRPQQRVLHIGGWVSLLLFGLFGVNAWLSYVL